VSASLATDSATGQGADSIPNVENLLGSSFGDTLTGDSGANALDGEAGNDELTCGLGADALSGEGGVDTARYLQAVNASLATGEATGSEGTDTLAEIENLSGSPARDNLTGDGGANRLSAGGGNDLLDGRGGGDRLLGGAGRETASFAAIAARVFASLRGGGASGQGRDALREIENMTGSPLGDVLTGSAVANVLRGLAGNDGLRGLAANDTLVGGRGRRDYCDGANGSVDRARGCERRPKIP
jgi:Ca2+-binding RTX toxin-like protein